MEKYDVDAASLDDLRTYAKNLQTMSLQLLAIFALRGNGYEKLLAELYEKLSKCKMDKLTDEEKAKKFKEYFLRSEFAIKKGGREMLPEHVQFYSVWKDMLFFGNMSNGIEVFLKGASAEDLAHPPESAGAAADGSSAAVVDHAVQEHQAEDPRGSSSVDQVQASEAEQLQAAQTVPLPASPLPPVCGEEGGNKGGKRKAKKHK